MASAFDFVNVVASARDLRVTNAHSHFCRLEPRKSELDWHCDLDDGTPTDSERDPAKYVRWVCPALRVRRSAPSTAVPLVDVRRTGPHSDLGRLVQGLGRLFGRSPKAPAGDPDGRFAYTDPSGILDAGLRQRIENWPPAQWDDGVMRPAELWSIACTGEGLIVQSVSWWDSAPALDHQIELAIDIARRMTARQ